MITYVRQENDETLQEDLDYIASSEIPAEALRDSKVLGLWSNGFDRCITC